MSNDNKYVSKAITTQIRATSRVAIKIRDNFYTIEYSEERTIPTDVDVNLDNERVLLWNDVNDVVDAQAEDIINSYKK